MSDPAENVVSFDQNKPAQLNFEGHAVTGVTESLRSLKVNKENVPIRQQFTPVRGWFEGRVAIIKFDGSNLDGQTGREQVIEVLSWGVEE